MDNQSHSDDKAVDYELEDVSNSSMKKVKFRLLGCLSIVSVFGILGAIAFPSFLDQAGKAKHSHAYVVLGAMNRAQQTKLSENRRFANSVDALDIGIKTQTTNFRYSVIATKMAAFSYIIPYQNDIKLSGSVGAVFIVPTTSENPQVDRNEITTVSIKCWAISPYKIRPANPLLKNGQPKCGAGTEEIHY